MTKHINLHTWFAFRFITFFISWSIFQSYWGLWLNGIGLVPFEIGLAVAVILIARSITTMWIYPILNNRFTLLTLSRTLPWIILFISSLYLITHNFTVLMIISVIFGLVYPIILSLNETAATIATKAGHLHYGPIRSLGTFGFILGTIITGFMVKFFGSEIIIVLFVFFCFIMAITGIVNPIHSKDLDIKSKGIAGIICLLRDKTFLSYLVVVIMIQSSHAAYYGFGAIRLTQITSSESIPLILAIAPISELILFMTMKLKFKNLNHKTLLILGAVTAILRWILISFSNNPVIFAFSQILHAGSYAVPHIAYALYICDKLPPQLHGPASGLYTAFAMGLGTALVTYFSGAIINISNFSTALLFMAVIATLAMFLTFFINFEERILDET